MSQKHSVVNQLNIDRSLKECVTGRDIYYTRFHTTINDELHEKSFSTKTSRLAEQTKERCFGNR